ncbi:MAG: thioredoxin [Candidatus Zixiibacteriota bacterium]
MAIPVVVTDDTFEAEVLKSELPVLVDFWAEWCAPCKMIAPAVEELAKSYDGKMKFAKLDVDSNNKTALQFGVMSIPTLIIFKDGQEKERIIGAVAKGQLEKKIIPNIQ